MNTWLFSLEIWKKIMKENKQEPVYQVIRTQRRTIAIQVKPDGTTVVRCPGRMPEKQVTEFVLAHKDWIRKHQETAGKRMEKRRILTAEEVNAYRKTAKAVLIQKTEEWAGKMGVEYGRITIRQQKTRWGSCSAAGNLNYNWKLILLPEPLMDYVVVHELAHRREMNHSKRFWAVVEKELPDYIQLRRRLRDYEGEINTQYQD